MLRRGALSLFNPIHGKSHLNYAMHLTAEELVSEFKEGKGVKTYWTVRNENNHWLDATYLSAAAGEICGVKLIAPSEKEIAPRMVDKDAPKQQPQQPQRRNPHGRFRQRPGGWIPRRNG
jgi:hypothetical protein